MKEYKECYIAVLDLLGFKDALNNTTCETITSIFDEINEDYNTTYDGTDIPIIEPGAIKKKVMSDTVCFYVETTVSNALPALIATCDYFQIRMLRLDKPMLSRGAIVKGELYHDKDVLFGNGFVHAYNMQEKAAIYPRVIIDCTIIKDYQAEDSRDQKYLDLFLTVDFDGYFFSDYLAEFYILNHDYPAWKRFMLHLNYMVENEKDERIRAKYSYLKSSIPRVKEKFWKFDEESNHNV